MSEQPCKNCDPDYPEPSGMLMGRDELWENGWHTHKRPGGGHMVFKGELGEAVAESRIAKFPWEEGWEEHPRPSAELQSKIDKTLEEETNG